METEPDKVVRAVLLDAIGAVEAASVEYLLVGGLAAACYGRPRASRDVDLLVRPADAPRTLEALADAGFELEKTELDWLDKARSRGVQVDVIHRVTSDVYLDADLLAHARIQQFDGREVRVASPEDLVVIKASVNAEQTPRHWHDALGILAAGQLDWDYLLEHSRYAGQRTLSLLVYAQSNDIVVPREVVLALFDRLYSDTPERDG